MTHRTYQYRLKPNKTQQAILAAILERDRQLYNAALQERRDAYDKAGVSITVYDLRTPCKTRVAFTFRLTAYGGQHLRTPCKTRVAFT